MKLITYTASSGIDPAHIVSDVAYLEIKIDDHIYRISPGNRPGAMNVNVLKQLVVLPKAANSIDVEERGF